MLTNKVRKKKKLMSVVGKNKSEHLSLYFNLIGIFALKRLVLTITGYSFFFSVCFFNLHNIKLHSVEMFV